MKAGNLKVPGGARRGLSERSKSLIGHATPPGIHYQVIHKKNKGEGGGSRQNQGMEG